ncbi:MAG: DUF4153 domain-containing protein [Sphingobacteriales bacterium]
MKFPSIKSLGEGILKTVKRFPFEVLFALCAAIAGTAWVRNHDYGSLYKDNCIRLMMMANLGLLLSLTFSLFTEGKEIKGSKKFLLKGLAVVFSVPFFWLLNPFAREYDTLRFFLISFAFHLLVAFAAFTQKGRIQGFWQFNKTLFLRFLAGMLYSGVLYLGLIAAILATKYLFNIDWSDDIYAILWGWIICVFNSVFFLAGVPADFNVLDEDSSYPKALKIFTQYVLIPLATVYVIILLAYEVKILIEWRLPKGYVSNLITGYAVFGILSILLVFPIREQAENKWLKIYTRYFYFLLIPLIVLLFLAMFARVIPYGITPQRYLLMTLSVWLSVITLYFLFSKKQSIKIIPISLCLLTLVSTYGPQSAFNVSVYSQRHILINIFKKYHAFKDGQFQTIKSKNIDEKDGKNAVAKLDFLTSNDNWEVLQPYMKESLKAVNDSLQNNPNESRAARNSYQRYNLQGDQLEWLKSHLGLEKFSQYGRYDLEDEGKNYYFSTENDHASSIKGYDYMVALASPYESRSDTNAYHADHIRFVRSDNDGVYSLLVNGEHVSFDLKDFANKLVKPEANLKKYKQNSANYGRYKDYTIADSLMIFTKETPKYTISLRIQELRFDMRTDATTTINQVSGYYLIKAR